MLTQHFVKFTGPEAQELGICVFFRDLASGNGLGPWEGALDPKIHVSGPKNKVEGVSCTLVACDVEIRPFPLQQKKPLKSHYFCKNSEKSFIFIENTRFLTIFEKIIKNHLFMF